MALKKCKECGTEVSTSAKACPKCGSPSPAGGSFLRIAGGVIGGLIALTILGAAMGGKKNTATTVEAAAIQGAQAVAAAEARGNLEFGKPTVKNNAIGMTEIAVEVKNVSGGDLRACTITATFKKGDTILGTANGAVNEVPAGQTRTAQLIGNDKVTGYDALKLEAATCF